MDLSMWATSDGPRIEEFGITEDDLARAPNLFLSSHRVGILFAAYLVAAVLVFILIIGTSRSVPAAAFFTVIALAAGSVLLLPALVLLACAGEHAERMWLCRRVPTLRACLAYQSALAEHRRLTDSAAARPREPDSWSTLSESTFSELLRTELDQRFQTSVSEADREETGCDYVLDLGGQRLLFRCEAGSKPVAAAVGRELVAALDDFRAQAAVIVTAAKPSSALEDYLVDRPITLATPWALDALEVPPS